MYIYVRILWSFGSQPCSCRWFFGSLGFIQWCTWGDPGWMLIPPLGEYLFILKSEFYMSHHVTLCIYIYISYGIISPSYPHHLLPYHGRPSSQVDSPFVAKRSRRRNCSWPRRWSYSPFCKRRISSTWPSVARLVWGGYNVANKTHSECTWLIGWDMI